MKKVISDLPRLTRTAGGAVARRMSTAQEPARIHVQTETPPKPRVEPVRWQPGAAAAPGWVAYRALVHRPGVEDCHVAMLARRVPGSTYDVSMKELAALWQLWYEPRQGGENLSVAYRFSDYHALVNEGAAIDPLEGPTRAQRDARNAFFDKLLPQVSDELYVRKQRLDKTPAALVMHKPAAPMQELQLRDGTLVWLRPLEGADAFQMHAFLSEENVSKSSFETRFPDADSSAPKREMLAAQLARHAEDERGYAVQDAAGRIVAHMDLKPTRHADTCEVDIVIADSLQGHGLGSTLLREARRLGAEAGCDCLRATVSDKNERMLKLLAAEGFKQVTNMYALKGHKSYELDLAGELAAAA